METKAKIRINLDTREFEIEGTEEFINSHANKIESFLGTITKISGSEKKAAAPAKAALSAPAKKRGRKPSVKPLAAKAPVAKAAEAPAKVEAPKAAAPAAKPATKTKVAAPKATKAPKAAKAPKAVKEKVAKPKVVKAKKAKVVKKAAPKAAATTINVGEFAGFYKRVPKDAKDIDKLLAASLYAQSQDGVKFFTAKDLNTLLNSQGVKLSNPAQYIKNSIKSKRMSQVARGKFKLSDEGLSYVNGFLAK